MILTFREKIEKLRKGASEAQSANKIMDMLKKLKDSNDENTSYRWVWELIQNAKDVTNSTGKVDIEIKFSEANKTIEFSHNGKLFTTENIIFLIEQVSTKERSLTAENKRKSTGKFGTGFLTTHLLSEKVWVDGFLQDEGENPRSFKTLLDRTGMDKVSIMTAISSSCDMLDGGTECIVDESQFNTKFVYELDELGIRTAKAGLSNLLVSIPYVLSFVPELNSIFVLADGFHRKICKGQEPESGLENSKITEVNITTESNGTTSAETRYVYVLSDNNIDVAIEVRLNNNVVHVIKIDERLPKIFCDFPLLGTNDFSFPVVVNSSYFNPTEPRNGIPLNQTEREGTDSNENMNIIKGAVTLFNTMLDHFVFRGYQEIYHMVKIPVQPEKDWLDNGWIEQELIEPIKNHIRKTSLIQDSTGVLRPLFDSWDQPRIYVMKDQTPEFRYKIWELSVKLFPQSMTKQDEIEHWHNSLWEDCRNFGILNLVESVERYTNVTALEKQLGHNSINWLNELINSFYVNFNNLSSELGRYPTILPNQHGTFLSQDKILVENNIDDVYKDIASIIDIDFRERLIDNRVSRLYLKGLNELRINDIFSELNQKIYQTSLNLETKSEFYKSIINLRVNNRNDKQEVFFKIAKYLYPNDFTNTETVFYIQDRLLLEALKFWRAKMCYDFSCCLGIQGTLNNYEFENEKAVHDWISNLIEYLLQEGEGSLLDTYPLLPNQYGNFKKREEIFLGSPKIEEILKDASKISGYDVRERLLSNGVRLNLPKNRIIPLSHIAPNIIRYVRDNSKNIGQQCAEVREKLRETYTWIRSNRGDHEVNDCFKDLIENFHWFYDDDEIAVSMAKSAEYDSVLERYSITNMAELVTILASYSETDVPNKETIEISKELLAQWGISSEEELSMALSNNVFGNGNIHESITGNGELFDYVNKILDRSINNIINFLDKHEDYELDRENLDSIAKTIFKVKKFGQDIYIIARPSDFEQVILYYETEIDLLDYDKDCELWVEDGSDSSPQKITLGKILKLTGINKIPLKEL